DGGIGPFAENGLDAVHLERRREGRPGRSLDAVVRPEDLGQSAELGEVAWLSPRVARGEASVARRMPVLGGDDQVEAALQPVRDGDDLVAARNRQRAARQEVVLDVDE